MAIMLMQSDIQLGRL